MSLIDKVGGYKIIYNWFDLLKEKGHFINGYVIMPNHVHALISFINSKQSINTIIGNGKRFMAYEIIKRLVVNNEAELLQKLSADIEPIRKVNKKMQEVWETSWKDYRSNTFVWQKLNYMNNNPCIENSNWLPTQLNTFIAQQNFILLVFKAFIPLQISWKWKT